MKDQRKRAIGVVRATAFHCFTVVRIGGKQDRCLWSEFGLDALVSGHLLMPLMHLLMKDQWKSSDSVV